MATITEQIKWKKKTREFKIVFEKSRAVGATVLQRVKVLTCRVRVLGLAQVYSWSSSFWFITPMEAAEDGSGSSAPSTPVAS